MTDDAVREFISTYYSNKLSAFGPTPSGVDWKNKSGQHLRFEKLLDHIPDTDGVSINDVGCGYGELLHVLLERYSSIDYFGTDLSSAMISHAHDLWGAHQLVKFQCRAGCGRLADYSLSSGIFNVKGDFSEEDWVSYIWQTMDEMSQNSRHGFAANFLTYHSDEDRKRPDLYYADPGHFVNESIVRYGHNVTMSHGYGLYEFTIFVGLDP